MPDIEMDDAHKQAALTGKLTPGQKRLRFEVLQAFRSFWRMPVFTKGAMRPPFELQDVEPLLRDAAEIVVRLCASRKWTLKHKGGTVHEFLFAFGTEENQELESIQPSSHPEAFMRSLVHAALKDDNGYVDGFTEANVDEGVTIIENAQNEQRHKQVDTLQRYAKSLADVVQQLVPEGKEKLSRADLDDVQRINSQLKHLVQSMHEVREARVRRNLDREARRRASEEERKNREKEAAEQAAAQAEAEETRLAAEAAVAEEAAAREEEEAATRKGLLSIEKVAKDVDEISLDIQDVLNGADALSATRAIEESHGDTLKALKSTEQLEHRMLGLTDKLMRELSTLDGILGPDEVRASRKAQVKAVQRLLDDVDRVQAQTKKVVAELRRIHQEQQQAIEQAQAEQERAKVEEEQSAADISAAGEEPSTDAEGDAELKDVVTTEPERSADDVTEEEWRSLRLRPRFEAEERPGSFVVSAMVPGMDTKDIKIELGQDGKTVTVSGFRKPSDAELDAMKRQLVQLRRDPHAYGYYFPSAAAGEEDDASLLLRRGAGRYGSFSETFRVPANVNAEKISASYDAGVLELLLPKVPVAKRPAARAFSPAEGRFGWGHPRSSAGLGRPGMFGDRDFWW